MFKTLALAAIVAASFASQASAGSLVSTNCRHSHYTGTTCSTSVSSIGSNSAQALSVANDAWTPEIDAKWEAFCKPTLTHDKLGIGRYSYAHEGCGFGRTE